MPQFSLSSTAFAHNTFIPKRYTCDGLNINPPLTIEGLPEGTKTLTLIVEDRDIPKEVKEKMGIEVYDHWVLFNIPPNIVCIQEGQVCGVHGVNSNKENKYTGPCPPAQYEPTEHRYNFLLYALDAELGLEEGATKEAVYAAMEGHILAQTELIGRYEKELPQ